MARNQERPNTDDHIAEASKQIQDLREAIREDPADLGGDPDDRAETHFHT